MVCNFINIIVLFQQFVTYSWLIYYKQVRGPLALTINETITRNQSRTGLDLYYSLSEIDINTATTKYNKHQNLQLKRYQINCHHAISIPQIRPTWFCRYYAIRVIWESPFLKINLDRSAHLYNTWLWPLYFCILTLNYTISYHTFLKNISHVCQFTFRTYSSLIKGEVTVIWTS